MVEDLLAARGVIVSHQTVRLWAEKFGRHFAKENPEAIDRQARRQMAVGYRTNYDPLSLRKDVLGQYHKSNVLVQCQMKTGLNPAENRQAGVNRGDLL